MNKNNIRAGQPHTLPASPCEKCSRGNKAGCMCDQWKEWAEECWRTVTARTGKNAK